MRDLGVEPRRSVPDAVMRMRRKHMSGPDARSDAAQRMHSNTILVPDAIHRLHMENGAGVRPAPVLSGLGP
eukprot:3170875-Rhodomonas_salina.1